VRDNGLYQDRLYLNDGLGEFTRSVDGIPETLFNTLSVQTLDVEADGDIDLVVGGNVKPGAFPSAFPSYLLINNGKGVFQKAENVLPNNGALGLVNDVAVADVNDDNKTDIVLAGDWMPVRILINQGKQFIDETESYGLRKSDGMWSTLRMLDINGDGKKDIVAGNRGTNSFYKCSQDQPAILHTTDFDDNGEEEALVSYHFFDGVLYPKYSLDEILQQMPSWRGMFSRYEKYSSATSNEIFTKSKYPNMKLYECNSLESTVFIREENKFVPHALPAEVQFSQTFGLVPLENPKNNVPMLFTAGNNFGVDVNTGRLDAGQGIISSWRDDKTSLELNSQIDIKGEVRQLQQVKTNNNNYLILVSRNGLSPQLFKKVR
jgi:hypothetical protein